MKKYLYKFSKKCLLLAIVPLLMFSSCNEDILTETPLDFLAPENAYNTIQGIQQGIIGLHYNVRRSFYTDAGNQDGMAIMLGGLGTDVAWHGENPGGNRKMVNYQAELTPVDWQTGYYWDVCYKLIQDANVLIDRIEVSDDDIWTSTAQKMAYEGEARFFRAWAYRYLVMLYGDVPLVTAVINSPKTDFTRDPKSEILRVIEEDLVYASANLPAPGSEEAPGRITQGAAWSLLSEAYLSDGKYQQAVDAASEIIDGGYYHLMTSRFGTTTDVFGSGDVLLDLFAYGNQNLPENREGLWVIQFEPLVTGGANFPGERGWGPAYFRMGNTPDGFKAFRGEFVNGKYTGYSDSLGRPVSWIRPTNHQAYDIWISDWNNDIRNAKHHIKRVFYYDNPASAYNKQVIDFSLYPSGSRDALKDTCQYIYPYFLKYGDPLNHFENPAQSGGGREWKDIYAMRLAETILLRAEAYVRLNKPTEAAFDINMIRNRANATPIAPAQANLDYILDERARELYGEENRHITLRRMGKLLERVRLYCNNPIYPACNIQDYNVLFPIPQKQIDLNIDAVLQQNPGY